MHLRNGSSNVSQCSLHRGIVTHCNHFGITVEIVNKCEELGVGTGGFRSGSKLQLYTMCLGRNWDMDTKYGERFRSDGSEAPPIPDEFIRIVKNALEVSRSHINYEEELPLMSPDACVVRFYATPGRLRLHQDGDESPYSLGVGLPVVSISIGDSANFLYGFDKEVDNASSVLLESGDVLIFGGMSRLIYHGVKSIIPNSAPLPLLKQTMLRPGRLNLTFRKF